MLGRFRQPKPRFARFRLLAPRREPPPGLILRRAQPADARVLARLSFQNRGGHVKVLHRRMVEEIEEAANTSLVLVAEVAGKPIAYGRVRFFQPDSSAPAHCCPAGWYLLGVIVQPRWRRRGIARRLTAERLEWVARRADCAYYFANELNPASIALHEGFGFREISRDFWYPRVTFRGGRGVLFRVELAAVGGSSAALSPAPGLPERPASSP